MVCCGPPSGMVSLVRVSSIGWRWPDFAGAVLAGIQGALVCCRLVAVPNQSGFAYTGCH